MGYSFTHRSIPNSPLLADDQGLLLHFTLSFENTVQAATANWKIWALKQGKDSVTHYSTEFQLLAQEDLGWEEAALRDQFVGGLSV